MVEIITKDSNRATMVEIITKEIIRSHYGGKYNNRFQPGPLWRKYRTIDLFT